MSPDSDYVVCRYAQHVPAEAESFLAPRKYFTGDVVTTPFSSRWVKLDDARQFHRKKEALTTARFLRDIKNESAELEVMTFAQAKHLEQTGERPKSESPRCEP
jgi:hypothetical protein